MPRNELFGWLRDSVLYFFGREVAVDAVTQMCLPDANVFSKHQDMDQYNVFSPNTTVFQTLQFWTLHVCLVHDYNFSRYAFLNILSHALTYFFLLNFTMSMTFILLAPLPVTTTLREKKKPQFTNLSLYPWVNNGFAWKDGTARLE